MLLRPEIVVQAGCCSHGILDCISRDYLSGSASGKIYLAYCLASPALTHYSALIFKLSEYDGGVRSFQSSLCLRIISYMLFSLCRVVNVR